jgi:N6-L-threonylcarbamoyladenine synthase
MADAEIEIEKNNLAASFQEAVVDVLISKLKYASRLHQIKNLVITGGVSANSRLRERAQELSQSGYTVVIPPLRYCTDNAAMIGYAGIQHLNLGEVSDLNMGPYSSSLEADFKIALMLEKK